MVNADSTGSFERRQIIPVSMRVSTDPLPRFRQRDHARSALVREILDQFNHEAARRFAAVPAPIVDDQNSESVVLSANEIVNTLRTGSHVVSQRRTVDFETLPELAIAEPPLVPVISTVRDDAAAALAAMNERPHARRGHRLPTKRLQTPRTASPVWLAAVIVLGALTAAVLLSRAAAGEPLVCRSSWRRARLPAATERPRMPAAAVLGDGFSGYTVERAADGVQIHVGRAHCKYCARTEAISQMAVIIHGGLL